MVTTPPSSPASVCGHRALSLAKGRKRLTQPPRCATTQRGGCCESASLGGKSVGRTRPGTPAQPIQPKAWTIKRPADGRWGDWVAITGRDGVPTVHASSVISEEYGLDVSLKYDNSSADMVITRANEWLHTVAH